MGIEFAKDRLVKAFEELRYSKKISSQTDFGKKLGYNKSYISELFNGHKPITSSLAGEIQTKFGINAIWIIGGIGNMYAKDDDGLNNTEPSKANDMLMGENTYGKNETNVLYLSPQKTKRSLFINENLNRPLFETLIPDNNNTNGYVPFYANASDIISAYTDLSNLKNEAMDKVWLKTPLIDDVFRVAYESSFCTRYMHDNMGSEVPLGSKITAKFKKFTAWRPGSLYCVFFVDGEMYIFGLSEGKDDRHVLLIDGKKGTKNQLIEDILCIAIVQEVMHPK